MLSTYMVYEFAKDQEQRLHNEAEQAHLLRQLNAQSSKKPKLAMQDLMYSLFGGLITRRKVHLN